MEPLSAFSVAAGVVQFLEFTGKVLSEGYEIYKSTTGDLQRNADLSQLAKKILQLNNDLQSSLKSTELRSQLSPAEEELQNLLSDCSSVANELLAALERLKLEPGEKKRKWSSFRQALRTIWRQDDITKLQLKLDSYKGQLTMYLLVSLRYAACPPHLNLSNDSRF